MREDHLWDEAPNSLLWLEGLFDVCSDYELVREVEEIDELND